MTEIVRKIRPDALISKPAAATQRASVPTMNDADSEPWNAWVNAAIQRRLVGFSKMLGEETGALAKHEREKMEAYVAGEIKKVSPKMLIAQITVLKKQVNALQSKIAVLERKAR